MQLWVRRSLSFLIVCGAVLTPPLSAAPWRWPLTARFVLQQGESGPGWIYRTIPTDPASVDGQPVSDGDLLFAAPPHQRHLVRTSAIPRLTEIAVYAHDNGFLSGYMAPELPSMLGGAPDRSDSVIPWLEFIIWDRRSQSSVNPRLLLSDPEEPLSTEVPPIVFLQNGQPVALSRLVAGPVTLALDLNSLNTARLPWELRIRHNGVLRKTSRYAFSAEKPEPPAVLLQFEARPGQNTIVLEATRFDRSTGQRTIRFSARRPEPPETEDLSIGP
jgi:hypothetical protein